MSDTTTRYRKKPAEIEATRWDGTAAGATPVIDWMLANGGTGRYHEAVDGSACPIAGSHSDRGGPHRYCSCGWDELGAVIVIDAREGTMTAEPGDWIIRGVDGDFSRAKPDVFAATYEPVGDGADQDRRTGDRLAAILRNG